MLFPDSCHHPGFARREHSLDEAVEVRHGKTRVHRYPQSSGALGNSGRPNSANGKAGRGSGGCKPKSGFIAAKNYRNNLGVASAGIEAGCAELQPKMRAQFFQAGPLDVRLRNECDRFL